MNKEKVCLECGEPIKGRADKKFCDDQCRSNYNNKANSDTSADMRNVNNILRKNRRILDSIISPEGKTKILKTKLSDKGFNFKYHTHTYTTQKGTTYKLCYDYGYLAIENDYIMVVKWGKESWTDRSDPPVAGQVYEKDDGQLNEKGQGTRNGEKTIRQLDENIHLRRDKWFDEKKCAV